jgi:hypothetical protein
MRQVAVPASTPTAEEDIDHCPSWEPTRPTVTREWSRSISSMKRKVTTLMEAKEAALFRASEFPSSLLHVEADLKGKKPFKDAVLRTNVAGTCGLALVRCGELAFSSLGKESTLMSRRNDAITSDSPKTWTPSSRSLRTVRKTSSTSARASGRSPTSARTLLQAPSTRAWTNCATWFGSHPSPKRCALPWSCAPFPNSSLRRRCQDSRGFGSGQAKAISGRLLPLQA